MTTTMPATSIAPVHPGEILADDLADLGINQSQLARALGVPRSRINQIVLGRRAIEADTALRLARYFGTSDRYWLNPAGPLRSGDREGRAGGRPGEGGAARRDGLRPDSSTVGLVGIPVIAGVSTAGPAVWLDAGVRAVALAVRKAPVVLALGGGVLGVGHAVASLWYMR
jgi:addiction module HigA family antidote